MVEPFPLIEIAGPPRERGRQYGTQAAARIHLGVKHYREQLGRASFAWSSIAAMVHEYVPHMERFDASYVEEMRGIAEGAQIDFEAVALLNARTEILKLGQRPDLRSKLMDATAEACTGVVVLPSATRDGRLVHAQNWDWKAECADTAVVVHVHRDDGPDLLTFTEAGGLARSGFNAAGIAIDFECAPDETFQVHPEQGLLGHANHFVSPVALSKLRDMGIANTPDSLYRDVRVRHLLAPQMGRITRDAVKQALLDDWQTPWSVCRPPRKGVTDTVSATVATIVMEPGRGVMEVAPLPALSPTFTTYRLAPHTSA